MTKMKCCRMLLHSPHIFCHQIFCSGPPVPSEVLVFHIDSKPVGLAVGVAENLFCRVHSVCTSTHSRIQSSPHDSDPPHASLHRCCRELHHPDTILCHDSKAAQPSSTTHSCPSSPKSLHPHSYTRDPLPIAPRNTSNCAKLVLHLVRFRDRPPPVHPRTSMPTQVFVS